jgi:uncharacterized protein HemX
MEPENTVKTPPENQTSTPVMDVVAPPPQASAPESPPTSEIDPVEAAFDEPAPQTEPATDKSDKPETPKPATTTVKKSGGNSSAAVTLAVIVMIVLAGLATFAYIQQNK